MSATPIPRSLALTIYGDLDVSIIDELPAGRSPIKTKWIQNEIDRQKMYNFMEKKMKDGRQVYIVSPLIEESESLNVKSAQETDEVDMMIVIGDTSSSNSKKLYELANEKVKSIFIEDVTELKKIMFEGVQKLGVTAGASTPV